GEGKQPVLDGGPDPAGARRRLPDGVQRVLQLDEQARGAEQQGGEAQDGGHDAARARGGVRDHQLDDPGGVGADGLARLGYEPGARRLLAVGEPGDGDEDQQQRGERQDGVEGEGRPQAGRLVVPPLGGGVLQQQANGFEG